MTNFAPLENLGKTTRMVFLCVILTVSILGLIYGAGTQEHHTFVTTTTVQTIQVGVWESGWEAKNNLAMVFFLGPFVVLIIAFWLGYSVTGRTENDGSG